MPSGVVIFGNSYLYQIHFMLPFGFPEGIFLLYGIKDDPKADIHKLFNHVGYRQRSTAWRNFQKITGMTPTEFVNNLK